jgi:hypothetical protein
VIKRPVYVGGDPSTRVPLSVRLDMRADKCDACSAKVMIFTPGFIKARRLARRETGQEILILCGNCAGDVKAADGGRVRESLAAPDHPQKYLTKPS